MITTKIVLVAQCPLPHVEETLHVNNYKATVLNRGNNFIGSNGEGFQVPYNGKETPESLFGTGLWFSGKDVLGNLKVASITYGNDLNCDYVPGPLPWDFYTYEDDEKEKLVRNWNKIFKVYGSDILRHTEDYKDGQIDDTIPSIFGWSGKNNQFFEEYNGFQLYDNGPRRIAPFYELNENQIYEPHLGEYPVVSSLRWGQYHIPGVIMWSVYHTGYSVEGDFIPNSPELEIHQVSWAMSCDDELLDNTIFTSYLVSHLGIDDLRDFRFGLWADPDLGCFEDDFVGSFPELNSFYVYNSDNKDTLCEQNLNGYGINPPVQTVTFLGELGMDGFYYYGNGLGGFQEDDHSVYNMLNGLWPDGTPVTYGGNGYNPGSIDTVNYVFPGDPSNIEGWSMMSENFPPIDVRVLAVNNYEEYGYGYPTNGILKPGAAFIFDIAYSFFRKEGADHLENIQFAKSEIPRLQDFFRDPLHFYDPCSLEWCDCDCVWPGDSNKDGIVNYKDVVNIYKYFGLEGQKRSSPIAWIGKEEDDWDNESFGQLNPKYADSNGDGLIDGLDVEIVDDLYGYENECYSPLGSSSIPGDEMYWESDYEHDELKKNTVLKIRLNLKNINALWGMSYEIKYDPEIFVFREINDLLQYSNSETSNLFYHNLNESEGAIKLVQFNDLNESVGLVNEVENQVLELEFFVWDLPESYPEEFVSIKIMDAWEYKDYGVAYAIPVQDFTIPFPDGVMTATSELIHDTPVFYPNPTTNYLIIETTSNSEIEIIDLKGKCVLKTSVDSDSIKIDLFTLDAGCYVIQIRDEHKEPLRRLFVKL